MLKRLEGSRFVVYLDAAGLPTIGIGHLLTQDERSSGKLWDGREWVSFRNGLSEEQITNLLAHDLNSFEDTVCNLLSGYGLKQHQYDALISFAFNVGAYAFRKSTLVKRIKQNRMGDVPDQFRRWKYSSGKVVQGLINRREVEIKMWLGEYE